MSRVARDWAWRCRALMPSLRLGLVALAEQADDNGGICMASLELLQRMTGLSRRVVAKTLNALEAAGLITSEPGGCDGATRYRLLLERPGGLRWTARGPNAKTDRKMGPNPHRDGKRGSSRSASTGKPLPSAYHNALRRAAAGAPGGCWPSRSAPRAHGGPAGGAR